MLPFFYFQSYTANLGVAMTFSRGCVDIEMENTGYCNGANRVVQNPVCCTEELCNGPKSWNGAGTIATNVILILINSLLLVRFI